MSLFFKTIIEVHSEHGEELLNTLYTLNNAFDFSKIIPLPVNHNKIHDLQNKEALYYFLTNRMTQVLKPFEAKMYFVHPHIPDLIPPSLENVISFTENYLSKFKEDGSFDTEVNAGFYPFPHKSLDDLFDSGKAIAGMIDKFNIDNLAYWQLHHWGSYTNSLCAKRISESSISFETLSKSILRVVKKFIDKNKLTCTVKTISMATQELIEEHSFINGIEAAAHTTIKG
jgi:hypothetical protein